MTGRNDTAAADVPTPPNRANDGAMPTATRSLFSLQRLLAYTIREALELLRDPIRLGFSLFGTTLLMLVFGFGVSTDVNNLSFAVLDQDQSPESRAYLEEARGSAYFIEKPAIARSNKVWLNHELHRPFGLSILQLGGNTIRQRREVNRIGLHFAPAYSREL